MGNNNMAGLQSGSQDREGILIMAQDIKHTPITDDDFYVAVGTMVEYTGNDVADICTCNPALFGQDKVAPSLEQQCANAEFIARACNNHYDLLEALEEIHEHGYSFHNYDKVEAAIAKAKGQ